MKLHLDIDKYNGSLKGCNGTGLYLSEARIIHSLFQHVILQESVWKRCDLRDNVFDSCVMYHGYKDADSRYPDSRAMRMEGCDLCGTRYVNVCNYLGRNTHLLRDS